MFLEIALSYLSLRRSEPSFTHPDSSYSWATLLVQGYTAFLYRGPLWARQINRGLDRLLRA